MIVAVGARRSRGLPVPGTDAKGVFGGIEFLRDVSYGQRYELGQRIVVIGGGNVAYDVGRTVVRQTAIDAARTALRSGVTDVYLTSLESLDDMPAEDIEIIEGDAEGIIRKNSLGQRRIIKDQGGELKESARLTFPSNVFSQCTLFHSNRGLVRDEREPLIHGVVRTTPCFRTESWVLRYYSIAATCCSGTCLATCTSFILVAALPNPP